MKLTVLITVVVIFQATAGSYAQRITLKAKGITLSKAMDEVYAQSGYQVFLNGRELAKKKIDVDLRDASIQEAMSVLLKDLPLIWTLKDNTIIIKEASNSPKKVEEVILLQDKEINGKVLDETGDPLEGVNVTVKGTSLGTKTNQAGNYQLRIPSSSRLLVFSMLGYKMEEMPVGTQQQINVTMKAEASDLSEVVVVGYGTQKKVNLTGAVASINIDEKITSRAVSNVSSALTGMLPGLSVNQSRGMAGNNSATMVIRGLGTVNNASPLVVVDGMPDVDINRINMNDIASISVLKDATSSSVYGSRAANGVILITTKSGKGQQPSISFSSNFALSQPTKSFEFMADYPRALTLSQQLEWVDTKKENLFFKDGTIDQWMALGMIDPRKYPNTDWWDVIMRNGAQRNYNLSATGGGDKSSFYLSAGMLDEEGLQINNDYKRYNARLNYDYKIRDNINVGAKFDGNWTNYTYAMDEGFTDDNASNTAGFDMQYAIAGILPYDPVTGNYGGVMAYNESPQAFNPYTRFVTQLTQRDRQEANASMFVEWEPIKGLTGKVDYALRYYNQFSYSAPIPNTAYNTQTESFGSRIYVGENAGISNNTTSGYKTMLNGQLNYKTTIADQHHISGLFVYSEEFWHARNLSASRNDRLHPSLHEIDAALTSVMSNSGNSYNEGLRSFIGRLNYDAFDKYLLEANFRYDGSSKFLPGSRYGFFPSVAVGWRFTEENFLHSLKESFLSSGKLRLSYGGLGNNSGVDYYEQQETLTGSNYMLGDNIAKGFIYEKMVNPDLSWEVTHVFNAGLDLGFFSNRLTAEIDYYDRLTTGMNRPSEMSIHLTGAYVAPRRNIGNLRNRGIEGNFTWTARGEEINYSVNLNVAYNATRLESWNEFLAKGYVFIDLPYHFLYTYEDNGIAQTWEDIYNNTPQGASPGDILRKDLNGDGRIDANDKKAYPNIQRDRPTTNFALNGSISWKGFDLNVLFQGATGRKDYWINNYNNVNFPEQRYAATWDHWNNPWSLENRDGEWPRLRGNANREETQFWLDDLSYIRLKNLQIGYNLPRRLFGHLKISNFRVFVSSENLATITSFRGLDPEITQESAANRNDLYPLVKSYSFGLNIGF